MFERFTERARRVIVLAQDEARLLHHDRIGAEHLLLGLFRVEEGMAVRVLELFGAQPQTLRKAVEARVEPGASARTEGEIPFAPQAKDVLELALREAIELGHRHIGTEHVLLGVLRQHEGVAAEVLERYGLEHDQVRERVLELTSQGPSGMPATLREAMKTHERLDRLEARLEEVSARLDALERRTRD